MCYLNEFVFIQNVFSVYLKEIPNYGALNYKIIKHVQKANYGIDNGASKINISVFSNGPNIFVHYIL